MYGTVQNKDISTYKADEFYSIFYHSGTTGGPTSEEWNYVLNVPTPNGTYRWQLCIVYHSPNLIYYRRCNASGWSDWIKLITE